MLTPTQALGYVRARYTLGNGSDLDRIDRQQAFMSSLVGRVKGQLLNPLAVYRFLDAATRSLTIDSELGGITGLYDLGQSLRDLPQDKIAFFTLPTFPRSEVVPSDTANVVWTQPEDNQIFASFRDDVPASSSPVRRPAGEPASGPHCRRPSRGRWRYSGFRRDIRGAGGERQPCDEPDRLAELGRPSGTHSKPEHLRRLRPRRAARRIPLTG
jgi:hypothetical protein